VAIAKFFAERAEHDAAGARPGEAYRPSPPPRKKRQQQTNRRQAARGGGKEAAADRLGAANANAARQRAAPNENSDGCQRRLSFRRKSMRTRENTNLWNVG